MKQQAIPHPRRSDCPGSFRSPASLGTSLLKRLFLVRQTLYATTESPSTLFPGCNPMCLVVKVLRQDGFLFIRSSGCRPLLTRSLLSYKKWRCLPHQIIMHGVGLLVRRNLFVSSSVSSLLASPIWSDTTPQLTRIHPDTHLLDRVRGFCCFS